MTECLWDFYSFKLMLNSANCNEQYEDEIAKLLNIESLMREIREEMKVFE